MQSILRFKQRGSISRAMVINSIAREMSPLCLKRRMFDMTFQRILSDSLNSFGNSILIFK